MKTYFIFLFLYFHCNVTADSKHGENSYSLMFKNHDDHLIANSAVPLECSIILDEFADYASNFTKCSIKNARPIRLCTQCIEHYINFHKKYEDLLNKTVNGTSCKSSFISQDRLDAVLEYHNNILAVWEKGNCGGCFDWSQGVPELSKNTINFNIKVNETLDCIAKHRNPGVNNTEVCQECMLHYVELDEFYKSLSADAIGVDVICMDIVDSMNTTRYKWSKVLNCCNLRKSPEIIFLCCTAIIAMLPLLFYVAVRFCGPIRDLPNVLKQSRFKQIIMRSTDRGIN